MSSKAVLSDTVVDIIGGYTRLNICYPNETVRNIYHMWDSWIKHFAFKIAWFYRPTGDSTYRAGLGGVVCIEVYGMLGHFQ